MLVAGSAPGCPDIATQPAFKQAAVVPTTATSMNAGCGKRPRLPRHSYAACFKQAAVVPTTATSMNAGCGKRPRLPRHSYAACFQASCSRSNDCNQHECWLREAPQAAQT